MKMSSLLVERTLASSKPSLWPTTIRQWLNSINCLASTPFFLDGSGLHIVEPAEPTDAGAEKGVVVKLASWSDLSHTSLAPHPPEVTDLIVMLEAA